MLSGWVRLGLGFSLNKIIYARQVQVRSDLGRVQILGSKKTSTPNLTTKFQCFLRQYDVVLEQLA